MGSGPQERCRHRGERCRAAVPPRPPGRGNLLSCWLGVALGAATSPSAWPGAMNASPLLATWHLLPNRTGKHALRLHKATPGLEFSPPRLLCSSSSSRRRTRPDHDDGLPMSGPWDQYEGPWPPSRSASAFSSPVVSSSQHQDGLLPRRCKLLFASLLLLISHQRTLFTASASQIRSFF